MFNLNKGLTWVGKHGLIMLVGLTILAFLMATFEKIGTDSGLWDSVIDTMTSSSSEAKGWTLVMHLLLNGVLAWAAVRVYMTTAGHTWDAIVARWWVRDHVVIVSGGELVTSEKMSKSSALAVEIALSLKGEGKRVVLCDHRLDPSAREHLWSAGVRVVNAALALPDILVASGVRRAQMLIAIREDHRENIALVRAAVSPAFGNPNLECKCMIESIIFKQHINVEDYFEAETLERIRTFNEAEIIARNLFLAYPPDLPVAESTTSRVHLLLVGLGSIGRAVLLQLAYVGHYRSGKKPKVTVVDQNVEQKWLELLMAYPAFEQWVQVDRIESHIEDLASTQISEWLQDEHPITGIYVTTFDEISNLRIARMLIIALQKCTEGILVAAKLVVVDHPGGHVMSELVANPNSSGRIKLISLARGARDNKTYETNFLAYLDDSQAIAQHESYLQLGNNTYGADPNWLLKPANKAWKDLSEKFRDSNRRQADRLDLDVKLRAIGCELVRDEDGDFVKLTQEEIELLARMEHDRWWAERTLSGESGHPSMVSFSFLSEDEKGKDRSRVIDLINQKAIEGWCVTRRSSVNAKTYI